MKVLVNGGLNLSELDGWWSEAYSPEVGWALGDGHEHGDDPASDRAEAHALYDLLEREVIPAFYTRDDRGIPMAWLQKMRASMLQLTPRFSSNRTVREYVDKYYLQAAGQYSKRAADESELGMKLSSWSKRIGELWSKVRFGAVSNREVGNQYGFDVEVFLGDLEASAVKVELYAEAKGDSGRTLQAMERQQDAPVGRAVYSCLVPRTRPASEYTPRIVPSMSGALVPLEQNNILWQR
jgi:starch phosphorylase